MNTLLRDIRFSLRVLLKNPGATIVMMLTLALGIGANTAIFSVVNGVLLRSLPYPEPERLVMLWQANNRVRNNPVSHLNFIDWRAQQHSFEAISAYSGRWGGPETVTGGSEPERAYVVSVYKDFFAVMGVAPVAGRTFSPEEERAGSTPVVVVSYGFWQRRLGGDKNLADKKLNVYGQSFNVIGVMPEGFGFPSDADLWLSKEQLGEDTSSRSSHNYIGIARLKPDVTLEQAQSEMSQIARRIVEQDPSDKDYNNVAVIPLREQLTGSARPALLVLLGAVCFVLLIACANVANLMLVRALGRYKEIAIRTALGASRARIVRQLLTETLLLSVVSGALGLLLAAWLLRAITAFAPATIPRLNEISLDSRALAFTLGVSLAASLLCGLAPALITSKPDLNETLKEGGRNTTGRSGLLSSALVVAEVALTIVLLVGTGLLLKSLQRVLQVNPGFNPKGVLTMQLALPAEEYSNSNRKIAFYRQLFERINAVPGVEAAGMINNLPLGGVDINGQLRIEGRPVEQSGTTSFRVVSPDYFRTLNIPLIRGRYFTEQDNESAEPVAIISERVAETIFRGEDPIGKRVLSSNDMTSMDEFNQTSRWQRIVGVVGDVKHFGLEARNSSDLYVCYMQRPSRIGEMTIVVRAKGEPLSLAAMLQQQVKAIDGNLPVSFTGMEQVFARATSSRRYNIILLGSFAALALLLATIGIYGVVSYSVSQSTREIGIRMALGAQTGDVLRLIVGQGLVLALIGICIGLLGSFWLTRLIKSLLFGITATDPYIFTGVPLLLITIATLAAYVPARRATKIDPMVALRYE